MTEKHVDAICEQIEAEDDPNKAVKEITLDQNFLSDEGLERILTTVFGKHPSNTLMTLNYTNNELGPRSLRVIHDLINKDLVKHLTDLRLSNLKISESCISQLFDTLKDNYNLNKLRISKIHLGSSRNIHQFTNFLKENRTFAELDLSWTSLNAK